MHVSVSNLTSAIDWSPSLLYDQNMHNELVVNVLVHFANSPSDNANYIFCCVLSIYEQDGHRLKGNGERLKCYIGGEVIPPQSFVDLPNAKSVRESNKPNF